MRKGERGTHLGGEYLDVVARSVGGRSVRRPMVVAVHAPRPRHVVVALAVEGPAAVPRLEVDPTHTLARGLALARRAADARDVELARVVVPGVGGADEAGAESGEAGVEEEVLPRGAQVVAEGPRGRG